MCNKCKLIEKGLTMSDVTKGITFISQTIKCVRHYKVMVLYKSERKGRFCKLEINV